jgi:dihydroxyacetone kinase
MKKIMNKADDIVDDMIAGVLLAHSSHLRATPESPRALVFADAPVPEKVGIVTGGGSGHLPLFLGYVGRNLLDGVAVGNVFSAPAASAVAAATRAVESGAGVLHLFGNYTGDVLNFQMAAELAAENGTRVETVTVTDDIFSAGKNETGTRRGIAGLALAYKIAGAKAALGGTLEEVAAVTRRAVQSMASAGVALSPCTVPSAGRATFEIGEDEMEIGMGIHGEPGIRRTRVMTAQGIAELLVPALLEDLGSPGGESMAVLVNGLGATSLCELYVLYREVDRCLERADVTRAKAYVGEYATSMEMKGCSVTLLQLDDELNELLELPCYSPFLPCWGSRERVATDRPGRHAHRSS